MSLNCSGDHASVDFSAMGGRPADADVHILDGSEASILLVD